MEVWVATITGQGQLTLRSCYGLAQSSLPCGGESSSAPVFPLLGWLKQAAGAHDNVPGLSCRCLA